MELYKIGQICDINPKTNIDIEADRQISFIPMNAVSTDGKADTSKTISPDSVKNYTVFKNGDILFAKITPCMENGKGAIAEKLKNGYGAGSTEFIILRPNQKLVNPKWLQLFLSQKIFRLYCQRHMTGSAGQKRVPPKFLANCDIPVPSLLEQERIVARIEELFSQLDANINELKTAKEQLKVYRQAVLKEAFNEQSAWSKCHFVDLMDGVKNGYGIKPTDTGEHRILKISAIRPMKLDVEECRYNEEPFGPEYLIEENDLLFTRYNGSREFVGACAYVPKLSIPYGYPDKLIKCTPKLQNPIHSKYLQYYMSQGDARKYIRSKIKTTSGQHGISGSDIKNTPVFLPNISTQAKVVTLIESRLTVCESIEKTVDTALQQAEALRQSILKKAFGGGL